MRLAPPVPPPAELREQRPTSVSAIDQLVHGMGFPREAAQAALDMSDGVLSRAVSELLGEELDHGSSGPRGDDEPSRLIAHQDREYEEMLARDRAREEQLRQQQEIGGLPVDSFAGGSAVSEPLVEPPPASTIMSPTVAREATSEPATADERRRILANAALSRLMQ